MVVDLNFAYKASPQYASLELTFLARTLELVSGTGDML